MLGLDVATAHESVVGRDTPHVPVAGQRVVPGLSHGSQVLLPGWVLGGSDQSRSATAASPPAKASVSTEAQRPSTLLPPMQTSPPSRFCRLPGFSSQLKSS